MQSKLGTFTGAHGVAEPCVETGGFGPQSYRGRVGVYENGKLEYSFALDVIRISRNDALADARAAAIEMNRSGGAAAATTSRTF